MVSRCIRRIQRQTRTMSAVKTATLELDLPTTTASTQIPAAPAACA